MAVNSQTNSENTAQTLIDESPVLPVAIYSHTTTSHQPIIDDQLMLNEKIRKPIIIITFIIAIIVIPLLALYLGSRLNPSGIFSYNQYGNFGLFSALYTLIATTIMMYPMSLAMIFSGDSLGTGSLFIIVLLLVPIIVICSAVCIKRLKLKSLKKSFLILEIIWSILLLIMTASAPSNSEGSEG